MNKERLNRLGFSGVAEPVSVTAASRGDNASIFDRWLLENMVRGLGSTLVDIELWDGSRADNSVAKPVGRIRIGDRGVLYGLILNPSLKFGDYYSEGRLSVDGDLSQVIELTSNSIAHVRSPFNRAKDFVELLRSTQNPRFSRHDIHHHYDIGNDFYQMWLDREAMQYTCAYYYRDTATLEQAQIAKMHHVCRKLDLRPGETVIEAGCGWGGFAIFMAKHYGVNVRAYNLSREQVVHARAWASTENLDGQVEFILDDFRNASGVCDAIVSIGMLEHIGRGNYRAIGQVIDNCLKENGRGLLHFIGRDRRAPINPWIARRIFPGAYPPTLKQLGVIFEPAGLSVLDVENLRPHYARTVNDWLVRYEAVADQVVDMFDETFYRAWKLYLAGSVATFKLGRLQLFQILFARSGRNPVPVTRAHQYK